MNHWIRAIAVIIGICPYCGEHRLLLIAYHYLSDVEGKRLYECKWCGEEYQNDMVDGIFEHLIQLK